MEDNKTISTEATENVASKEPEVKITRNAPTYNRDDYMKEYYLYDDMFYYDERCFSCKHRLGYNCGAPTGPCNYESF